MTSNRDKAKKVLQALRGNYKKSFSDMSAEDLKLMIDICSLLFLKRTRVCLS